MDDLELIKQKVNIVDLIQEYLPLKKTGVNFKANCPFHNEKTPSFVVSPERGIWHCFGCGKGGDHFKFLMEKEGIEFSEALEILAKRVGITLKRGRGKQSDQRSKLFEINLKAAQFFSYLLISHKLGKKAEVYLKNRGITDQTIKDFNLGYAPNSWDSLTNFLLKKGFTKAELIESGLAVPSKNGCYDRFRGRIIFPLKDAKDQVIGFAGRVLGLGEPKYINTPQTPIFDKSSFLFGLNLAKSEVRQKNQVILTEGEMDMILSFQSGIKNVVASKGTALTVGQIELIKKYTDTILICFDMDLAGDAASRRGIEMAQNLGLNIKMVHLGEGKDPAELSSKNPTFWAKAVEEAEPIYDYYLKSADSRFNSKTSEGKRKISEELLPIWSKIGSPLIFEDYLQKLSALLRVSEDILRREIKKVNANEKVPSYKTVLYQDKTKIEISPKSREEILEEYLLSLLLKIPPSLTFVPTIPESIFLSENRRSIYVMLVLYLDAISFKAKSFNVSDFVKDLPLELVNLVDRLYLTELDDKLEVPEAWLKEVDKASSELKKVLIKGSLDRLSRDIKNAQVFGKIDQLDGLNKRFRDLSVKLKNL